MIHPSFLLRQAHGSKDQAEPEIDEIDFWLRLIFRTMSLPH